jgi:hypothetical protein
MQKKVMVIRRPGVKRIALSLLGAMLLMVCSQSSRIDEEAAMPASTGESIINYFGVHLLVNTQSPNGDDKICWGKNDEANST